MSIDVPRPSVVRSRPAGSVSPSSAALHPPASGRRLEREGRRAENRTVCRPLLQALGLAFTLVALLAAAGSAGADWLVTEEGGRVETRGAWEVKGRLVVFTKADGQLSSLRLDDVDLEASRAATAAAVEAAERSQEAEEEKPQPEPRPPRRKITDADIPPGSGAASRPAPVEGEAAAAPAAADAADGPAADNLVVVFSEAEEGDSGHTRVRGTLANRGGGPAVGVRLTVHLYGYQGETLGSASAQLASTALQAGETTSFIADFPEVFSYAAMSFEPRGTSLARIPEGESGEGAGAGEGSNRGSEEGAGPGSEGDS